MPLFCKRCATPVDQKPGQKYSQMRCPTCNGRAFTSIQPEHILEDIPLGEWELTDVDKIRLIHYGIDYED